jgi:ABC-type bacteriocin/lantibiotic exporter with double-glycine peptidase domain
VCFGRNYNEERFSYAMDVSQLKSDIQLFAKQENTTVGERGINISGG